MWKRVFPALLVEMQMGTASLESRMAAFIKIKNTNLLTWQSIS